MSLRVNLRANNRTRTSASPFGIASLPVRGMVRGAVALALTVCVVLPTASRADDQDVIDYRRHIMKTMGEQVAAIGQILQKKVPAGQFATHVEILAVTAATAKQAFTPNVPGGEAKDEVWAKWADFSKRMDELVAATADLAKTSKQGGMAAAAPKIQSALTCKGCHDVYHNEKK